MILLIDREICLTTFRHCGAKSSFLVLNFLDFSFWPKLRHNLYPGLQLPAPGWNKK